MRNIYLSALGGSGENGRNCYMIGVDDWVLLCDCGVKREIVDGTVGFYPALNEEIVKKVRYVFLSHCHEDHVAALPLLYHYGYRGKVYASKETIAQTPGFLRKWCDFVKKQNGQLPFEESSIEKIQFEELAPGEWRLEDLTVTVGRTGHVLGATWFVFEIDGKKILYTGDMVLQSATLETDIPPACDSAIMNGAYAGQSIVQEAQYEQLAEAVAAAYKQGGSVLLPIPPKGRGIDILQFLDGVLTEEKIYVEKVVVDSLLELAGKTGWVKDNFRTALSEKVTVITTAEDRAAALQAAQGIYITGDGMLTTEISGQYYQALKGKKENLILITGHAAKGTIAAGVLDEEYRRQHGVQAGADKIIFKVHLDDEDIYTLCTQIPVRNTVVLFHAEQEKNKNITERLKTQGIDVRTLTYPDKVIV